MTNVLSLIEDDAAVIERLHSLNLKTYWDVLLHIPIRYEDCTTISSISESLPETKVVVQGIIQQVHQIKYKTKQLQVVINDGTSNLVLIFFHFYPNYVTQYKIGKTIRVYGEIKLDFHGNKSIIHPKALSESKPLPQTLTPIYSSVTGLTQKKIMSLVDQALNYLLQVDLIPDTYVPDLPRLSEAITLLHKMQAKFNSSTIINKAIARLKLEELLAQQFILYNKYLEKVSRTSTILKPKATLTRKLLDGLPYKLTKSQTQVLAEIYADIAKPTQMIRLLQGDVGSGKTIVATLAMLVAVENNFQACIIAPTEILAEQHYLKTKNLLINLNLNVVWLAGSLNSKERSAAYSSIASGAANIIIGTHAVFQKNVEFNNLALVVIDEQHRFGVEQRLQLQLKGINPHQLMMSATPIPRTLAMSYFSNLDISTINELPIGRVPIKTLLVNNNRRHEVINFIDSHCTSGGQAYWVCPLIEESEKLNLENVQNVYEEMCLKLPRIKVALIHGKIKAAEKSKIMDDFRDQQIKLLIATTVIEVGVDVPNASVMIIEHSERMGLSQLHQLRGRVGRGNIQSQCVLLYQSPVSEIAQKRLKVIYENSDGFAIADNDLLLRGPGEILGYKQSGLPNLKFANLEQDLDLLKKAKELVKIIATEQSSIPQLHINLWHHNQDKYLSV
ncbi:MAG: ATP-dependent helicase RecG [Pseudomonadota bacterium]|jgi:ATP-dependent DNA helicase RecG|nr:ATP-dependent DNA helicase RecG [Burkholderiales bacterium]